MTATISKALFAYAVLGLAGLLVLTLAVLPACWLIGMMSRRLGGDVPAVRFAVMGLGPLWALVALLFAAGLMAERLAAWEVGRYHYSLAGPRVMDGLSLPAGTFVDVEPGGRLSSLRLPDGTSVVLAGERWRGSIEIRNGRAISGVPSDPVSRDGVQCAAGDPVASWQDGRLRSCQLAADRAWAGLACRGGRLAEFSEHPVPHPVTTCELRDTYRSDSIACAAGQVVRFEQGRLQRCILAEPLVRAGLTVPAGAEVTVGFASQTIVIATAPAPDGWTIGEITVPPGTDVVLRRSGRVEYISLPPSRSVAVGRGRLTGTLYYDETQFDRGSLAEMLTVDGRSIGVGVTVSREQLGLVHPGVESR